jgi:methionyl aminopeptidase
LILLAPQSLRIWTVATADGSLCAHFEHTIAVTDGEPEMLTV